jgi:hypothetical protein
MFAHQDFRVVGIPVLGAVTLGQFVLEGGAARFGLTGCGASHCQWQVIGIAHGRKVNYVHNRKFLRIKDTLPAENVFKPHKALARHKLCRI